MKPEEGDIVHKYTFAEQQQDYVEESANDTTARFGYSMPQLH